MRHIHGVDSETGTLRTVLTHRPGLELKRITPRHAERLLSGHLPWADWAQQEHDNFTQTLRDHGVEVLYLTELLQDTPECWRPASPPSGPASVPPRPGWNGWPGGCSRPG